MRLKKTTALVAILLTGSALFAGCETVKGAGQGIAKDSKNAWHALAGAGGAIQKADNWIKKNLW